MPETTVLKECILEFNLNTYTASFLILINFRAAGYTVDPSLNAFDEIMNMHKSTLRLNYYPKRPTAHTTGKLLSVIEVALSIPYQEQDLEAF